MDKLRFLSGNALKLIAAVSMLLDHIGVIFFPRVAIFRILGRLAFPIFAFMIAEGCRYTRNKARYFLTMASLTLVIQTVYYIALDSLNMCILFTFSLSILIIYALQWFKRSMFSPHVKTHVKVFSFLLLLGMTVGVYVLDMFIYMDYDFVGCMIPVLASIPHSEENYPDSVKKLDKHYVSILIMGIGLIWLALVNIRIQFFSLITIPLLLMYSGKRGKLKMKYFFYLFYPLHLVLLYGLNMLLNYISI